MLEHREQRNRRQSIRGGAREQTQEGGGRRVRERLAGAVVDDDAVAGELGGDAEGELAIGGDKGGSGVRALQGVAEGEGDGDGFFLLVCRFQTH